MLPDDLSVIYSEFFGLERKTFEELVTSLKVSKYLSSPCLGPSDQLDLVLVEW